MDNLEYITKRTKSLVCPRKRNELIQSLIDDSNIDGNMRWYIENQDTLVWLYNGKHLVIVDRQVLGIFDTYEETQRWTEEKFYGEDFMIIKCEPGTRQYYIDEVR